MPELPEVETARSGIEPHLIGRRVVAVSVRQRQLRWPVSPALRERLPGQQIRSVDRRAKYLLLRTDAGTLILHLGMSGSLRLLDPETPPGKHDHLDIHVEGGRPGSSGLVLRLHDPRRFGAALWTARDPHRHRLLRHLGPEPLGPEFSGDHLHERARGRRIALRDFLLDGRVVVGVGNIYASEAAFRCGIHPARAAGRISLARYRHLAQAVREVLAEAIERGGTTLRDFVGDDGRPGSYGQALRVYGREGRECPNCSGPIRRRVLGQRSAFFCPSCQR